MKLKIGTKVIVSFVVVLIFTASLGILSVIQMQKLDSTLKDLGQNRIVKTQMLGNLKGTQAEYRTYVINYIFAKYRNDALAQTEYITKLENTIKVFEGELTTLKMLVVNSKGKELIANIENSWNELKATDLEVIALSDAKKDSEAISLLIGADKTKYAANNAALEAFVDYNRGKADTAVVAGDALVVSARNLIIILAILAVVIGLGLAIYISAGLSNSVNLVLKNALRVADGDLTVEEIKLKSKDEIGDLAAVFNRMVNNLRNIINQISGTAQKVAATSEDLSINAGEAATVAQQVANAISQVAHGTNEQTKSITDSVKNVEQLSQAITQIALGAQEQSKNVKETTRLAAIRKDIMTKMAKGMDNIEQAAVENGEVATKGGEAVGRTVTGMLQVKDAVFDTANKINALGEMSQQIGEIIQVIDDIAEQTNLLALNAAIEAARAGEHGKGFAVVADEVRKLAERSGNSTKEITSLINEIQRGTKLAVESMNLGSREVEAGVSLAGEAGTSLKAIVDGINASGQELQRVMVLMDEAMEVGKNVAVAMNNVALITDENTTATVEMSASASQVDLSMENMAAISEESAASAEEVSASTEELTASIGEMAKATKTLADMADELYEIVGKFKLLN